MTVDSDRATHILDVLVIGAGFGGLCMGIKALEAGLDFVILERAGKLAGAGRKTPIPALPVTPKAINTVFRLRPIPIGRSNFLSNLKFSTIYRTPQIDLV